MPGLFDYGAGGGGLLDRRPAVAPGTTDPNAAYQMPRLPWAQNDAITTAALGLIGGRNFNESMQNVAQMVPAALASNTAKRRDMYSIQEADKVRDAWNRVMQAKSAGQPIPADAQAIIAQSNPTVAASIFEDATGIGGGNDASLVPIWGTDANGNTVLVQPTKSGAAIQTQLPEGFTPSKGIDKIDAGTEWLLVDKQTGTVIGRQPKNIAEAESQKVQGGKQAEAAANLPIATANANRLTSMIDAVLKDPYLPNMTGPAAAWLPNVSADAHRVQSRIDQIMGGTFLQAYNDLRGGGQITEKEGEKATAAYNRLQTTAMGDEDYVDALTEFRNEVVNLLEIAKRKAVASPVAPGGSAPISSDDFMSSP